MVKNSVTKTMWYTEFTNGNNQIGVGRKPYWLFRRISGLASRIADWDTQKGITGAIMKLRWKTSYKFRDQ